MTIPAIAPPEREEEEEEETAGTAEVTKGMGEDVGGTVAMVEEEVTDEVAGREDDVTVVGEVRMVVAAAELEDDDDDDRAAVTGMVPVAVMLLLVSPNCVGTLAFCSPGIVLIHRLMLLKVSEDIYESDGHAPGL